jgi:hypothetical protein
MGEVHDGVNFMRAACVIAIEKAQVSFEPLLEALRQRSVHIMRRMFPIVEQMVSRNSYSVGGATELYTRPLQDVIRQIYFKFIDLKIEECLCKCKDDLRGMTRFVTWDVDGRGGSSGIYKCVFSNSIIIIIFVLPVSVLKNRSLPTPKKLAEIYTVAVDTSSKKFKKAPESSNSHPKSVGNRKSIKKMTSTEPERVLDEWVAASSLQEREDALQRDSVEASVIRNSGANLNVATHISSDDDAQIADYFDLLQLMEEMLAGRNEHRTSTVVTAIVQFITR